jgi:hypothetical protein
MELPGGLDGLSKVAGDAIAEEDDVGILSKQDFRIKRQRGGVVCMVVVQNKSIQSLIDHTEYKQLLYDSRNDM